MHFSQEPRSFPKSQVGQAVSIPFTRAAASWVMVRTPPPSMLTNPARLPRWERLGGVYDAPLPQVYHDFLCFPGAKSCAWDGDTWKGIELISEV